VKAYVHNSSCGKELHQTGCLVAMDANITGSDHQRIDDKQGLLSYEKGRAYCSAFFVSDYLFLFF